MSTIGGFTNGMSFMAAYRGLQKNQAALAGALERLATGQRINRGSDDPAGLITSENLRAVLAALDAETRTLERADHVAATADAALAEVSGMLTEAEGLVVANANSAGMSDEERQANQMQIDALMNSVNRIASTTSFNGQKLLDGTATLSAAGETIEIASVAMGPIGEGAAAQAALAAARENVTTTRGQLGAFSRHTVGSALDAIGVAMENTAAAESTIRDTDYGAELADLSRLTVLNDAGLAAFRMIAKTQTSVLNVLG